jgi:hypothetical protein
MESYDLQQCIDRGLAKFGTDAAQKLYWLLLSKCNLNTEGIVSNPPEFVKALYEIFGENGGKSIERAIIKELKNTFSLSLDECRNLTEAISSASKQVTSTLIA